MTLDSALEHLYDLADKLERYDPELTGETVLQARMFAATIQSASVKDVPLNDALTDTLGVCRKLELLLKLYQRSETGDRKGLEARP